MAQIVATKSIDLASTGLGLGGTKLRGVGKAETRAADGHGLEQRIAPPGDGGEMEDRIAFEQPVIADIYSP